MEVRGKSIVAESIVAAGSIVSAAVAGAIAGSNGAREIWLGMLAPLVVVLVTWTVIEKVYTQQAERLTLVMMTAFVGKLVFFGAYVGVAVGVMHVRPVPFAISFTVYFIALHAIEALWLRRLFVS